MKRTIYAVILVSVAVLACSQNIFSKKEDVLPLKPTFDEHGYWKTPSFRIKKEKDGTYSFYGANSLYGAYLAGVIAHARHDLDIATEYYKIVMEKDAKNENVNRVTYLTLASLGNIDEASDYAKNAINNPEKNILAVLIMSIKNFNDGNYAQAREYIKKLEVQKFHESVVNPMFDAWAYAGERNEEQAIASLNKMDDPMLESLKLIHQGMIYDYLGNTQKADEYYRTIIQKRPQDVTYRVLEVITNFYARNGKKDFALQISKRYNDNGVLATLLTNVNNKIKNTSKNSPPVIDTANKGLAEALFNIGTLYRSVSGAHEFAKFYIASSLFLNPSYDISKIAIANIYEELGMLKEANKYYADINSESGSYFISQLKLIENLNTLEQYKDAESILRKLLKDYPENTQLLNNLADIERMTNQNKKAISLYKKAIKAQNGAQLHNIWPIYYSLGISYYKDNQMDKAEESLQKALELSNRNPNVLNYLGYIYLIDNVNIDSAVQMIIDAYKQYNYEGHIIDSMGWVYYKLGRYDTAIMFLEQASDINPANAVISDHLGDAYWFIGRKNEAQHQWQHALVLKEDAEEVDREAIKHKIENGLVKNELISITDPKILNQLDDLSSGSSLISSAE